MLFIKNRTSRVKSFEIIFQLVVINKTTNRTFPSFQKTIVRRQAQVKSVDK